MPVTRFLSIEIPIARVEIARLRSLGRLLTSPDVGRYLKETRVKLSQWLTFTLAVVIIALEVLALTAVSSTVAVPAGACDMRLRVGLSRDVPNAREEGCLRSLLSNPPGDQLTFLREAPCAVGLD